MLWTSCQSIIRKFFSTDFILYIQPQLRTLKRKLFFQTVIPSNILSPGVSVFFNRQAGTPVGLQSCKPCSSCLPNKEECRPAGGCLCMCERWRYCSGRCCDICCQMCVDVCSGLCSGDCGYSFCTLFPQSDTVSGVIFYHRTN